MLWRVVVIAVGIGFVAYRGALWLEIRKARRAGDRAREEHLRRHGFGLYRWAALLVLIFTVLLTALVWSNSR
jgi:hypothetical protein